MSNPNNDWAQKRIQAIVKYFGTEFFNGKKVLDVGSGNGIVARAFADLGAKVTCVDARKNLLDAIYYSNPTIRCVKADLDQEWPFGNEQFDLTLHLGTLNHLMYVEKHLQIICNATNYLVLDTQVCDSTNPTKYVLVKENRGNGEHSVNGVGCRPSPAFVERILANSGMHFQLLDDGSCNSGRYIYNWNPKNSNAIPFGISRMWFAQRQTLKVIRELPKSAPAEPPKRVPSTFAAVWPPPSEPIKPEPISTPAKTEPANRPNISSYFDQSIVPDYVRRNSKEFSLIQPETFTPQAVFPTKGTILPLSISSRMWFRKIAPFFPGLRVHHLARTMDGFPKSEAEASITMCSVDNIHIANVLWIDEWSNYKLTAEDVRKLKMCTKIVTSSLINAQSILTEIPGANVQRAVRPWPMLNVQADGIRKHFIYFEKNVAITKTLFDSWDPSFGKLVVVGSSVKVPDFAEYVSDCEDFLTITKLIKEARAILEITDNDYYASGISTLAKGFGIPVITNNQFGIDSPPHQHVLFDRTTAPWPPPENIRNALRKFVESPVKGTLDNNYNQTVLLSNVKKLVG